MLVQRPCDVVRELFIGVADDLRRVSDDGVPSKNLEGMISLILADDVLYVYLVLVMLGLVVQIEVHVSRFSQSTSMTPSSRNTRIPESTRSWTPPVSRYSFK